MRLFSFIKKLAVGVLLLQGQMQAASPLKNNAKILLEDGAAHPVNDDVLFNPCEDLGFHLIAGKATRNTTRWLIGEMHTHPKASRECVERLARQPGKTSIYLEGIDFRKDDVKCEYYFNHLKSNSKIQCLGWDDLDAQYEAHDADPQLGFIIRMISFQNNYYQNQGSESQFESYLNKKASIDENDEFLNKIIPKKYVKKEAEYQRSTAKRLAEERKKAPSFDALFKAYMNEESYYYSTELDRMHLKRNKALINALRAHPEDHRAILVAGKGHFNPIESDNNPRTRNYVSNALESDKTSYAVLEFRPKR